MYSDQVRSIRRVENGHTAHDARGTQVGGGWGQNCTDLRHILGHEPTVNQARMWRRRGVIVRP